MGSGARSMRDAFWALLPGLGLLLAGVSIGDPALTRAFLAAGGLTVLLAIMGSLLSHIAAGQSMRHLLMAMVVGMLLRLGGVAVFCFAMTLWPDVHLVAACLAAAGGVLLCLLIDSACLAQRLSASSPPPTPTQSETAGA